MSRYCPVMFLSVMKKLDRDPNVLFIPSQHGMELLPDSWMSISQAQVKMTVRKHIYFIPWLIVDETTKAMLKVRMGICQQGCWSAEIRTTTGVCLLQLL